MRFFEYVILAEKIFAFNLPLLPLTLYIFLHAFYIGQYLFLAKTYIKDKYNNTMKYLFSY